MNVNEMLIKLFESLGLEAQQDEYVGNQDKYVIFVYEDEEPAENGDNQVLADAVYLQIQLITPKSFNYFSLKRKIKFALEKEEFFVTSIRSFLGDVYQGTEKIRQTVFEVNFTESRKEEE